jgi:Protein of unknown function (DUF2628)
MAVYTVHEPPRRANRASPAPERFVFVRDAFSLTAALFAPLWMLRHRMWLVLLGYAVVLVLLAFALRVTQASGMIDATVGVLLALLVGFEAGTLRRFTLARRGFRNVAVVVADDIDLAERRFFDSWIHGAAEPPSAPSSPLMLAPLGAPHGASDVIGLFPEPGASR